MIPFSPLQSIPRFNFRRALSFHILGRINLRRGERSDEIPGDLRILEGRQKASVRGGRRLGDGIGGQRKKSKKVDCQNTHQALSLFDIDWSLGLGGHWRAKVRGWLHERRVTEGSEGPGDVRPSVFRLRHGRREEESYGQVSTGEVGGGSWKAVEANV